MALRFALELRGGDALRGRLEERQARLADWRRPLALVRDDFRQYERELFESEGAAGGRGPWAPLKPSVRLWKARRYPGKSLLRRTDALYRSLTQPNARGSLGRIDGDRLIVGTTLTTPDGRRNLGALHHEGRGALPSRPLLEVSEARLARWAGVVREAMLSPSLAEAR